MLPYRQQEAAVYNGMHELSEADHAVKSGSKYTAIDRLLKIIKDHDLENCVGIRLLHKHNDIALDETMVEEHAVDDFGFALITKARPASVLNAEHVPNSWILSGNRFVPVEFSHKILINDCKINLINNKRFFQELAIEIRALGLSSVIGPSLLGSSFINSHKPPESSIMMEFTAQDDRANILRFVTNDEKADTSSMGVVETHWCISFSDKESDANTVIRTCKRICPAIGSPPKHQGTYIHQQP